MELASIRMIIIINLMDKSVMTCFVSKVCSGYKYLRVIV